MKIGYLVVLAIAGFLVPVMAAINSAVAIHIQSIAAALCVCLLIALCAALLLAYAHHGSALSLPLMHLNMLPKYYFLGGLGVTFYLFATALVAPKLGMGVSVTCVLVGQLMSIMFIDHFGLFGFNRTPFSMQRAVGLLFFVVGIVLMLHKRA